MTDLRKYITDRGQYRMKKLLIEIYMKSKDDKFRRIFDDLGMQLHEIRGFLVDVGWSFGSKIIACEEINDLIGLDEDLYPLDPVVNGYLSCFFRKENISWATGVDRSVVIADDVLMHDMQNNTSDGLLWEWDCAVHAAAEELRDHYTINSGQTLSETMKEKQPGFDPEIDDDSFGGIIFMKIRDEDPLTVNSVMESLNFCETEDPEQWYRFTLESYDDTFLMETWLYEEMGNWMKLLSEYAQDTAKAVTAPAMRAFTEMERLMEYPDGNIRVGSLIRFVADKHYTETQVMV